MGTYRYLLRRPDVTLERGLGYYTADGIIGYFSPEDPHDPRSPKALPVGTRIRGDDGQVYEIIEKAKRNIPDLVIGVLFVRPVDETLDA